MALNESDFADLNALVREILRDAGEKRLLARGMARAVIRRNGVLPEPAPRFGENLTPQLLEFAFGSLVVALELRSDRETAQIAAQAFRDAGEALDAVVRNGAEQAESDFYRIVASAAFHLGGYAARAYSSLPAAVRSANITLAEQVLALLMRRDLLELRAICATYLSNTGSRQNIEAMTQRAAGDPEGFLRNVLTAHFARAMILFSRALLTGQERLVADTVAMLDEELRVIESVGFVPLWWTVRLARELADELWNHSLHRQLPPHLPNGGEAERSWSSLRRQYIDNLVAKARSQVELWPSQLAAVSRIFADDKSFVVALPTGAGKTRIAELAILKAMSRKQRVFYVTPLRALSAQVERDLRRAFDSMGVLISSLYSSIGAQELDLVSLRAADIVVLTPEKLHFAIRMEPSLLDDVGLIVLDEGHMIGLNLREIRYEALVQKLLQRDDAGTRRLLCLSAVLPSGEELKDFAAWIGADNESPAIDISWRPTQLRFGDVDWRGSAARLTFYDAAEAEGFFAPRFIEAKLVPTPLRRTPRQFPRTRNELLCAVAEKYVRDQETVLIYSPQQNWVESLAGEVADCVATGGVSFPVPDQSILARALRIAREWLGPAHVVVRALQVGVGVHHGDLPMVLREEIEGLFKDGHIRVLISSPTLAQGLNITVAVVLFSSFYRVGEQIELSEFINVCGRAGRPFAASEGHVLFCAYPRPSVSAKSRTLSAWKSLVSQVEQRHLRSGILALVAGLVKAMANRGIGSFAELSEYILNLRERGDKDSIEVANGLSLYADTLDETILALIGDREVEASHIADALDSVLAGSLWERELARIEETLRDGYWMFLAERARYVWHRTTEEQRKRFFMAGLSVDAGLALEAVLPDLAEAYAAAETAIQERDIDSLTENAISIARGLFTVKPFRGDDEPPDGWQGMLTAWLSGTGLAQGNAIDPEVLPFVQGVCAYHLVWGIEAIRAFIGEEAGLEPQQIAPSQLSALMEVGVPNTDALYLVRAGLDSRTAATLISKIYDIGAGSVSDVLSWVEQCDKDQFDDVEWPSEETRTSWTTFVERSTELIGNVFDDVLDVDWTGNVPRTGHMVDAIPTGKRGRFALFGDHPETPIGTLNRPGIRRAFRGAVLLEGVLPL